MREAFIFESFKNSSASNQQKYISGFAIVETEKLQLVPIYCRAETI